MLDLTIGIVGAVVLEVITADAVPGVISVLAAAKGDEPHRRLVVEVAHLAKVAHQLAAGTVAVAVTADVRQTGLDGPVVAQHAAANSQGLLVGIKRAVAARQLGKRLTREALGAHVHTSAKGSRAIGRSAHAALYLNVAHRRGKVGRVHPVDAMTLGIVHGDVVDGDVDARGIGATHTHRRVTHAGARVTGSDHARRHRQQERDVQSVVLGRQLLASDVSKRHGSRA